jgi:hypothetical protein
MGGRALMHIRWNNGYLHAGLMFYQDTYGIELAWGRRDILEGREIPPGERLFADVKRFIICDGLSARIHGSIWKAALAKLFGYR